MRRRAGFATAAGVGAAIFAAGGLAPAVVAAGLEAGWILNATGPSTLRLAPPLTVPVAELERFAAALPGLVAAALTPAEGDRP